MYNNFYCYYTEQVENKLKKKIGNLLNLTLHYLRIKVVLD